MDRRATTALVYVVVVAVQGLFLVPLAILRPVDGDEGFYSLAATLVADGRLPYEDFAYLQTPLLPFVYGAWSALSGESWYGLRLLSVLMAVALGLLLYHHVSARLSSPVMGFAAVLLYASSEFVFEWYVVIKTYALSTLLLFAAYVLVARADDIGAHGGPSRRRWLVAGALLGLAIDVRLLFAAVVPVFAVYALLGSRRLRDRGASVASLLGGLWVGLLPTLYFLALDPGRFFFETLEYQRNRSNEDFWTAVGHKLTVLGHVFRDDPQFTILVVVAAVAVVSLALVRRRLLLALAIAGALGVASLLPTPTFAQYYSTLVPFLVVGGLELVAVVRSRPVAVDNSTRRRVLGALASLAVVAYVVVGGIELDRTLSPSAERDAELSNVRAVASTIDANTRPGETVLAFWPGHLYGSHAEPLPGFENDFAPMVINSGRLSPERAARYRLSSIYALIHVIRSRRLRLIVWSPELGITNYLVEAQLYLPRPDTFSAAGYQSIATVRSTTLYRRQPRERARLTVRRGRTVILGSSGSKIEVVRGAVSGFVEHVEARGSGLSIVGWAADTKGRRVADRVMVFTGDRLLVAGPTSVPRPDIAKAFGRSLQRSGYSLRVVTDRATEPATPARIRVFAVSGGVASELKRLR